MVDILKTKKLPTALTSYDLLKALALLLMFVDHTGYFFFSDEMWFRVVGRLSVPIWFFLIGYAQTREVPKLFWIVGVAVAFSALMSGEYLFPMSIIFTLILARMMVDWMFAHAMRNKEAFAGMFFFLFLMSGPSLIFIEYGTLGLLFTLLGTIRRQDDALQAPRWMFWCYTLAAAVAYIVEQSVLMPRLDMAQLSFFAAGMAVLSVWFYRYTPRVYERINLKSFPPVVLLLLLGRRTLEIYALHLVVLRVILVCIDPRFKLFSFQVFAFKQVQAFFF